MPSVYTRTPNQYPGAYIERYETADCADCAPHTRDAEAGTPPTLETLIARVGRLEHAIALLACDPIDADDTDTEDEGESQATAGAKQIGSAVVTGIKKVVGKDEELPLHSAPGMSSTPKPRATTADTLRARTDALLANTNRLIGTIQERNRARFG